MPPTPDELLAQLRTVLLEDWDPHNAIRSEAAHHTYDGYLRPLAELLQTKPTEEEVMNWLHEREKETMCFPSLGRERLRRVTQKLIRIANP